MSKSRGHIRGPFVPILKNTMKAGAWRALSHGARSLFIALHCRYNYKTENTVYLSTRAASNELGSHKDRVTRWYHELNHYGFIRMVSPGCLGVEGKGKAPHWRLTDVCYAGQAPTRDFEHWDGISYYERKGPKIYQAKKQNPVPKSGDAVSHKAGTPLSLKTGTTHAPTAPKIRDIQSDCAVPERRDITSLPLPVASQGGRDGDGLDIPDFLRRV
jgi:hypothetical protein